MPNPIHPTTPPLYLRVMICIDTVRPMKGRDINEIDYLPMISSVRVDGLQLVND